MKIVQPANCARCNEPINTKISRRSRIIPNVIGKWTRAPKYYGDYYLNRPYFCKNCSGMLASRIPTEEDILNMNLSFMYENFAINTLRELEPYIKDLEEMKERVHKKQNGLCPMCNREFPVDRMDPRRISNNIGRREDNCQLVCEECADDYKTKKFYEGLW